MVRDHGVDFVFAEPSGIVIPFELRNTIASAGRDVKVDAGTVVMLLSTADPEAPFHEHMAHVTRQQIEQADLIVLTKMDLAADGAAEHLRGTVRGLARETPIHSVSVNDGRGIAELVGAILGPAA